MGEVERDPNGTFCWVDLGTNDASAAKAFWRRTPREGSNLFDSIGPRLTFERRSRNPGVV